MLVAPSLLVSMISCRPFLDDADAVSHDQVPKGRGLLRRLLGGFAVTNNVGEIM